MSTLDDQFEGQRDIQWRRCKLPTETLKKLNERSDWEGWKQAGGHLALMILSGAATFYTWHIENWWLFAVSLFLHGTFCSFNINAVHELIHGTVFKTKWLNAFFAHLYGFIGINNNRQFWFSHTEHHKYTLHPPDDLEVQVPQHYTVWGWLRGGLFNVWAVYGIRNNFFWALGKTRGDWEKHIMGEPKRMAHVRSWAATILLGHLLICSVSLYYGLWIIPLITTFHGLYGNWLFQLCNNTQHAGLVENVADFRLNCRTIYLDPISEFLYWRMNYHIEHHMYAAVPCYNLHKLHEAIKDELPHTPNGLMETWTEIGYIMYQQKLDKEFRYVPELPDEKGQYKDNATRLEQIRKQADGRRVQAAVTNGPNRRWECTICGFIYEEARGLPEEGIAPGTAWDDIPDDWSCPDCGVSKAEFDMIEITEGRPAAGGEQKQAAVPAEAKSDAGQSVLILGSGLAAYGLAREIRKREKGLPITLITRDQGDYYSKPMLSNALAQGKQASELAQASAAEMADQLGITVKTGVRVEAINRQEKRVITNQGSFAYDRLVLALGADPIELPIAGDGAEGILRVNDLEDYGRFRKQLPEKGRVSIVGAGLIGCEFANDLAANGYRVEVVDLAPQALGRLVPKEIASAVQSALEAKGVKFYFEDSIEAVEKREGKLLAARLKSGRWLESEVVLSAVGLRARIGLAADAGLKVGKGIEVDANLRSSDPHIYALGDCASVDGDVKPFILPLTAGAKALASTLTGEPTAVDYGLMPVVVKTPACPLVVAPPAPCDEGSWKVTGEEADLVARFENKEGHLLGFALTGEKTAEKKRLSEEAEAVRKQVLPKPEVKA